LGELSDSFEYGLNAAATKYDGKNKYIRITDIDDESKRFIETNLTSPKIDCKRQIARH
jgi:type I restriction enzyme S subunit